LWFPVPLAGTLQEMTTMSNSVQPSIVLAAYAETAASGRRVLLVGNALGGLAEELVQRGARFVHVCDTDPLRLSEAAAKSRSPNVSFGPFADGHAALQNGAFELAVVENLGASDASSVVRRVRRLLSARGLALFACPNPDARLPLLEIPEPGAIALDYYALYDAVAAAFPVVRMCGQAPFVGYAVADFAPDGEPEPTLDTAFVPGGAEEPDWFIAAAAQYPIELEQFYVVQLPTRSVLSAAHGASGGDALRLAREEQRALRERVIELERRLRENTRPAESAAPEQPLQREIERQKAWIAELESRATLAGERAERAETELEEFRTRAEHELAERRDAEATLKKRLAEAEEAASTSDGEEIGAYERQLAERGAELRRLTRELRAAERLGRELLRERAQPAGDGQSPWAVEIARREADLVAARWTVEILENELAAATGRRAGSEPDAEAARAELQRRAVLNAQVEGARNG
jgi:hypothetical protein